MIKYKKTLKFTIIFLLISIVSTVSYFIYSFEKNSHINSETSTVLESGNSSDIDEEMPDLRTVEGITNVLLIGSDARSLNEKSRSDAIMILTIDSIHKKLKLTSILRDTYVKIPGHGEEKINHSFNYGGPELLIKTIENNFSIKLDKYVIVNFFGFNDLINAIGGLDIDIKPEEVKEANRSMLGINENPSNLIKISGLQHFNGQQVLAYSRIRHVGNGCYDRTERQRHVVSLIIDKFADTPIVKYPVVASKLLPYVKTNMDITEILNYAYTVYQIKNFTPEQLLVPLTELSYGQLLSHKGWVLLMDKYQNAKILNDFIFDDKTYSKSDLDYTSYKKAIDIYLSKIEKPKENNKTTPNKVAKENNTDNTVNTPDKEKPKNNTDNNADNNNTDNKENNDDNKNITPDDSTDEENTLGENATEDTTENATEDTTDGNDNTSPEKEDSEKKDNKENSGDSTENNENNENNKNAKENTEASNKNNTDETTTKDNSSNTEDAAN